MTMAKLRPLERTVAGGAAKSGAALPRRAQSRRKFKTRGDISD
jgi:hypothetical protein